MILTINADCFPVTIKFPCLFLEEYRRRTRRALLVLSAIDAGERSIHALANLLPRKNCGIHSTQGWVGPRAGLGVLEKREISCFYRDSNPGPSSP
jgi:hypothetical protein